MKCSDAFGLNIFYRSELTSASEASKIIAERNTFLQEEIKKKNGEVKALDKEVSQPI